MTLVLAATAAMAAGSAVLTALLLPGRPVQTAERATAEAATAP
jgi:hypothetical protein